MIALPVRRSVPDGPEAQAPRLLLAIVPLLALLAPLACGPSPRRALADPVPAPEENPRNAPRKGPLLPYLRTDVRAAAPAPARRRAFPEGEAVRWFVAPDPGGPKEPLPAVRFRLDRRPREPVRDGGPGDATGGSVRWTATARREELSAEIDGDRCVVATDALTVALLVERETLSEGDRRFGSLVRRVRASLDALNDLFAASVHPYAPRGVEERFRLDDALVYDRAAGPASVLADPTAFDVAWVLHDGLPPGADVPSVPGLQTIGGGRSGGPSAPPPWSTAWEHARWRDLLRTRGIPRLEGYVPGAGALPGRSDGAMPLPAPFAGDLAAEGAAMPSIGEWTAVVLNQRRGVFRPGSADDPVDARFGVAFTWLPGRVALELAREGGGDGRPRGESGGEGGEAGASPPGAGVGAAQPLAGTIVRWWRARRGAGLPEGVAGVAADRPPDGSVTSDAAGRFALAGDLLGHAAPPGERSRWLLLEVESGGERRFAILSALDLSLAYARGAKYLATFRLEWERLRTVRPAAPVPVR